MKASLKQAKIYGLQTNGVKQSSKANIRNGKRNWREREREREGNGSPKSPSTFMDSINPIASIDM